MPTNTYVPPPSMDFHWTFPFLIGIVVMMFVVSFTYADHIEPFVDQLRLLCQVRDADRAELQAGHVAQDAPEPFANYTKCSTHPTRGILKDIFDTYSIYQTRGEDWDIFLPCTYTHVERELRRLPSPCTQTERLTQSSLLPVPESGQRKAIFAVDGCDGLVSKNRLWATLVRRYGRQRACTIMPPTYILSDEPDRKLFLEEHVPGATYICKKNVQRKEGLLMSDNMDTLLGSHAHGYKVVQQYITDVHTVRQHKLNLRLYVLIVCEPWTGRKRLFVHRDGKCMYTAKPYDPNTWQDETSQITSVDTNAEQYEGNAPLPLTFEQLRAHWSTQKVAYDGVMGRVHRALRDTVTAVLPDMCRATKFQNHVRFQLFGADVLLRRDSMEPLVLEFNKGPSMRPVNQADYAVKRRVLEDVFRHVGLIAPSMHDAPVSGFVELV